MDLGRDTGDDRYQVDFAYLLREGTKVRTEYDHHTLGLFPRGEWERLILDAGFEYCVQPYGHRQGPEGSCGIFVGRKGLDRERTFKSSDTAGISASAKNHSHWMMDNQMGPNTLRPTGVAV